MRGGEDMWTIPNKDKINSGTVTIITAPAGGATSIFGSDLARVLDNDQDGLRVLPVLGKGPVRNVVDILYLKAIDMGAVTAEVPEFYRLQYGIPDIASRLRYIAKLYNNEVHIVAKTNIKSVFDLEGKRITAQTDVGYYSAKVICNRLGINATFDYRTDDARAVQNIIDGATDAYVGSTGKPFFLLRNIKNEDRSLHFVTVPYDKRLQDMYLPTTLTSEDYPNLVSAGEQIDTVATSVLLTAFNWPTNSERYARVAKFVNAFFSKIDEFQKPPRHPKWRESSISIVVPGWTRFKAAQDWLDANAPKASAGGASQAEFAAFMERTGKRNVPPDEMDRLYREFLEWRRRPH
ncbi:MAG: hypothetical protein JO000_29240 [Alphaproteobacteria bacterium]|nr:hypothetical protein [Alphaproteobacteria bacterium]